jgi:exodeoxyribonuclease V beta subunit
MASAPQERPEVLDLFRFPLHGTRLIEASAGTGKTFTLALLYTRLVLGHGDEAGAFGQPLVPPQILVVTFTDAATQELRERIRERLVEAAERFESSASSAGCPGSPASPASPAPSGRSPSDPLMALRESYPPERWPSCARLLRQAAAWMDEAVIATIHGWCQRMLQEHAFATRGLFQRELVTDQTDLIAEILRDYWRVHCYGLSPPEAAAIQSIVASPDALRGKLVDWLARRDAGLSYRGEPLQCDDLSTPLAEHCRWQAEAREIAREMQAQRVALDAERAQLEDQARAHWRAHRGALERYLREIRPHLKGREHASVRADDFDALLAEIGAWAESGAAAPGRIKHFAQGAFQFKKAAPVQSEPDHPAFAAIAAWQAALSPPASDASDPSDGPQAPVQPPEPPLEACLLAHAAAWVGRELPRRLRARAEMGFDDLLRELEAALRPNDGSAAAREQARALAATIRGQFPVALIDEFQDTDPIQYRIFSAIYGPDASAAATPGERTALVMIGDPKQAIYGFRGADIHAYLAARRASRGRHYSLGRNYRSTKALVEACNRVFSQAEQHARGAFRFRVDGEDPIPYLSVDAKGRDEHLIIDGQPAPAMTFWRLESDEAPITSGEYRSRMAEAAASEVLRWLQQARAARSGFAREGDLQPLQPKDIAILVRTGDEAAAMRDALSARGIHSVYLSDRESVFATEEAGDLLHWLRACAAPTDEGLVRAALATNTLGLPLEELAELQQDELAWEAEIERFRAYRQVWQRRGVLAMLRQLMHEADLPARLLARTGGERILTNLLHLAEWLQEAAIALDGEQALIRHLSEHLGQSSDEFIVRLETDAELVQVITIHKSKGLEYPLVLLPFICSWRAVTGRSHQVPYRLPPGRYLEVAGKKRFEAAWSAADDERLSEDMRLLYVALTRARHAVWLGIAALSSNGSKSPRLERSAIGYLLSGGESFETPQAVWKALERLKGDCESIAITAAPDLLQARLAPASPVELEPARTPTHGRFEPWWISSYSALRQGAEGAVSAADVALAHRPDSGPPSDPPSGPQSGPGMGAGVSPAIRSGLNPALDLGLSPHNAALADDSRSLEAGSVETAAQETAREESVLAQASAPAATIPAVQPMRASLHAFPRGSRYGTFLHGLFEWAAHQACQQQDGTRYQGFAAAVQGAAERRDMLARRCALRGLHEWIDPLDDWLTSMLTQTWILPGLGHPPAASPPALVLQDLTPCQLQVEMEFWLESRSVDTVLLDRLVLAHCLPGRSRPRLRANQLNGLLKGFIDLVFEHHGRYYVLDWKSNWLGPDDSAYTAQAMTRAVLEHRYDLQYLLYLLALHRLLRTRLPDYDYERHLGGAIYVFLRGSQAPSQGLFTDRPSRALIEALDQLFAGVPVGDLGPMAGHAADA